MHKTYLFPCKLAITNLISCKFSFTVRGMDKNISSFFLNKSVCDENMPIRLDLNKLY